MIHKLKARFWKFVFQWMHNTSIRAYEHVKLADPKMPTDYVSTSMITEPLSGKLKQVDVFSTTSARNQMHEREGVAQYARDHQLSIHEASRRLRMMPEDRLTLEQRDELALESGE